MIKILHITTHMGGGVGKVLSGISKYANSTSDKYKHKIILLEKPEKLNFIEECLNSGVEILISDNIDEIGKEIEKSHIVQLEWWHHPKFANFLKNFPKKNTRLVIWSHISGCVYPNIPSDFVDIPSKFIFTSDYSYENPQWKEVERTYIRENTTVINSSGGFEKFKHKKIEKHDGFNIGYIGTLNYSKLNENFYKYYESLDIDDSKFIIVGDNQNIENIENDLKKANIYDKTCIKGYVNDVSEEMKNFDVFSYLLSEKHFGTTENVLLEAMAIGLPVIALNQCAEKYLIKNMETGILVNSIDEYKKSMKYLYTHPEERYRIGQNARKFVLEKFSQRKTVEKLHKVYDEIINKDKKIYDFKDVFGECPYEWFLTCLGSEKETFIKSLENDGYLENSGKMKTDLTILKDNNKSSINHFVKYYPDDKKLKYWKKIIE